MNKLVPVLFVVIFFFTNSNTVKAQDDCCGLGSIFSSLIQSGVYGGYGMQQYSAEGLNNYYKDYLDYKDFGTAMGWRVGANLIGIRQRDFIVTLKFYYQSVLEKQELSGFYEGNPATQELKVNLTQFDLGMGFSYILGPNFDLRIMDLMISWHNAKFTNTIRTENAPPKQEFNSPESTIGVTADAGIVWYPFPPYLSLEILGGYSIFSIEKVDLDGGSNFPTDNVDFIDGGGFFAMAVLTVGIPFN